MKKWIKCDCLCQKTTVETWEKLHTFPGWNASHGVGHGTFWYISQRKKIFSVHWNSKQKARQNNEHFTEANLKSNIKRQRDASRFFVSKLKLVFLMTTGNWHKSRMNTVKSSNSTWSKRRLVIASNWQSQKHVSWKMDSFGEESWEMEH